MNVYALDVGGQGDFMTVLVPLCAGQADGLFKTGLAMGAQYLDGCIISECFLHGLFCMMRLGPVSAFGTGGGNGEFLGHRVSPLDDGSVSGMPYS